MTDSAACPDCKGSGVMGGPGSYYDAPGKGKPCGTCDGRGTVSSAASGEPFVNVTKVAHHIQISREMALDYGLIEPTDEDRNRWAAAKAEHERWRRSFRGRRTRLRSWLRAHRPVLHLGDCPRSDYDD